MGSDTNTVKHLRLVHMDIRLVHMNALCFSSIVPNVNLAYLDTLDVHPVISPIFCNTRSYAALRAADLDLTVGLGYSWGG